MLTKDQIKSFVAKAVEVTTSRGVVHLRKWSLDERLTIANMAKAESPQLLTFILLFSFSDEHGKRLFNDTEIIEVSGLDPSFAEEIVTEAKNINLPSNEKEGGRFLEVKNAKYVASLLENSENQSNKS